jgi:UDP-N-acetylglucosamine--N-acetylmuramyl-(pentapeptide) pyrophosphoryl-undecaprenol N-acetylglucosamine transferase
MSGPVLIMAGGTGGHVFPALAVADELRKRAIEVTWLGTRRGLEARVVPDASIEIDWIDVSGVRGKGPGARAMSALRLVRALIQAMRVIMRRRPTVVLGMGGFASGPGGIAAWLLRRPLVIHEQNSVAGLTNRYLARVARRVLCAFPGAFDGTSASGREVEVVGNPVRTAIGEVERPREPVEGRARRLLILGGSQGAQALNEMVPAALAAMPAAQRPEIWHQCGEKNIEAAGAAYASADVDVRLVPFIDDMAEAYGWADLVVCRAGALTVSELALAGVAAILVPFPFAVDDHQTGNAMFLKNAGAAFVVAQSDLDPVRLTRLLEQTLARPEVLVDMAQRARALARPHAAVEVADVCMSLAAGASA